MVYSLFRKTHGGCRNALGALFDTYEEEGLFQKGQSFGQYWKMRLHSLKSLPCMSYDFRNMASSACY